MSLLSFFFLFKAIEIPPGDGRGEEDVMDASATIRRIYIYNGDKKHSTTGNLKEKRGCDLLKKKKNPPLPPEGKKKEGCDTWVLPEAVLPFSFPLPFSLILPPIHTHTHTLITHREKATGFLKVKKTLDKNSFPLVTI